MKERLVAIFNDRDEKNAYDLERMIRRIPGIETLRYKPVVYNRIEERKRQWRLLELFYINGINGAGLSDFYNAIIVIYS